MCQNGHRLITSHAPLLQISFYDINRGTSDLVGRVIAHGTMGTPLCLGTCTTERSDQEQLVYGNDAGEVIMLLTGQRALPPKLLTNDAHNKDYEVLHAEHLDWVTQVCLIGCILFLASHLFQCLGVKHSIPGQQLGMQGTTVQRLWCCCQTLDLLPTCVLDSSANCLP